VALVSSGTRSLRGEGIESVAATAPLAPIDGALVICGGGPTLPEVAREFIHLAGGRQARVVIVTTASVYADSPSIERLLGSWRRHEVASLDVLHTRSRAVADRDAFCEPLTRATGVWFMGGDQCRITDAYLGTQTERRLHEVLRRGGVIGGTSAGAAIMSKVMIEDGVVRPQLGRGLSFLPGAVVDQHFLARNREARLVNALRTEPDLLGLGIDECTALVVQGANLRVIGASAVCVYSLDGSDDPAPQVQVLRPGDQTNMAHLCRALRPTVAVASAEMAAE
jgi:cyanophycinase